MLWQLYLLLGAFTPRALGAPLLPNGYHSCGGAIIHGDDPSQPLPADDHCEPSEQIYHTALPTQVMPLSVANSPKWEGKCDPLGFLSGNPSNWCPGDQYCDPFKSVCKPQLATRATWVDAENLPRPELQTSLSSLKEHHEIVRRGPLAVGDYETCPSRETTRMRCAMGQLCEPLTQVYKPVTTVQAEEAETAKPSPAICDTPSSNPSELLLTRYPDCPCSGNTELGCGSHSTPSVEMEIPASMLSVPQCPSTYTSLETPKAQIDTSERDALAYFTEQQLGPDEERECCGGRMPGPLCCPAGRYCDWIDLEGHGPQDALSETAQTVSIAPVIASSSAPGRANAETTVAFCEAEPLSNCTQQTRHLEGERGCCAWGERGSPEIFCPAGQYCDRTNYICRRPKQIVSVMALTASPYPAMQTTFTPKRNEADEPIGVLKNKVANYSERELPPYDQRECYPFGDYGGVGRWCPPGEYCDSVDYVCRTNARLVSEIARTVLLPSATAFRPSVSHLNDTEESSTRPLLLIMSGSKSKSSTGSGPGPSAAPQHPTLGTFTVIGVSGVPAMHAALMPNGRVFFLDKVENYSPISLPNGRLAFSSEFDPATSQVVPLAYKTNAFCSAGAFLADGRAISVGGNGPLSYLDPTVSDGFDGIRYLERSATDKRLDGGPWSEPGNKLASKRWYASAQTMPDGSVFVASGSLTGLVITDNVNNNPTYEVLDANAITTGRNVAMDILVKNQPYYLYPFIHLLRDGSLFVFSSRSSQIFHVDDNRIIRHMPDLIGLHRTYPNSGGSVMLPLSSQTGYAADMVICGGGAFVDITSPTEASCGRIQPESNTPTWEMDAMPQGRVMVEGTLLPDGTVLWLNGAQTGAQGFGIADEPALDALIYDPAEPLGRRWSVAGRSEIPRLYHSVAVLLLDGTVLVAGGNPNEQPVLPPDVNPNITMQKYPTEYRVEIYTPPYLVGDKVAKRPQDLVISTHTLRADGSTFEVSFKAPPGGQHGKILLSHGGFVTHGLHMGQRMVVLDHEGGEGEGEKKRLQVHMPETRVGNNVLPPGPYVLYAVVDGVPSIGQFIMVE